MEKRDYKKEQEMENGTDIRFQLDILRRDGYHAAARIIESMQGTVSQESIISTWRSASSGSG